MDELNNDELPVVEEGEKKDPFSDFFDEEYPAGDLTYEDTVKPEVLEALDPQPGEEQPESDLESDVLPDTELITSIAVDVDTFNQKMDQLEISICSSIVFAAFMVCGCLAAIKMFGGKLA